MLLPITASLNDAEFNTDGSILNAIEILPNFKIT
jgi:hypothetical protein